MQASFDAYKQAPGIISRVLSRFTDEEPEAEFEGMAFTREDLAEMPEEDFETLLQAAPAFEYERRVRGIEITGPRTVDRDGAAVKAYQEGGLVAPEERGIASVIYDKFAGEDPTEDIRNSGRVGGPRSAELYGEDPTFMSRLITDYGYPAKQDPRTGELIIPTGGQSEKIRMARPVGREDLPTYPELEDARAHMLGSALMAKKYGPETAESAGTFKEFMDRFAPFPMGGQNRRDAEMDQRNNAVGRQIFMKAGINATPEQLTRMVDSAIFSQLDVIMGRSKAEQTTPPESMPRAPRNFMSPETGPDVYFPRNEEGYFDTTREMFFVSPTKYRNYQ